jgi:hypothetical protein
MVKQIVGANLGFALSITGFFGSAHHKHLIFIEYKLKWFYQGCFCPYSCFLPKWIVYYLTDPGRNEGLIKDGLKKPSVFRLSRLLNRHNV